MKKLLFITLMLIFASISQSAYAQFRTDSNTVTTKVGNPQTQTIAACPIPGGNITCGSKNVPVNGCGHCGIGYQAYMKGCTYEGIYFAMDIAGNDLQNVILPSVDGKTIQWSFVSQTNSDGSQAIQRYSGTNITTGEKYWLQLHHTNPGSATKGIKPSGEVGAQICGNGCNMKHVHVEFAKIDASGTKWQDAPSYFCKS